LSQLFRAHAGKSSAQKGMHGEMSLNGQRIMMGQGAKEWGMVSSFATRWKNWS
jgi:hypothetical protein